METDLNRIMANIYGDSLNANSLSRTFSLSLSGGASRATIKPNVKFVDVHVQNARDIKTSNLYSAMTTNKHFDGGFTGGAKAETVVSEIKDFASAESEDAHRFYLEFMLYPLVSTCRFGSIIVVPKTSTLTAMISDLHAELKKAGIERLSPEASKYLILSSLPYKRYIFDQPAKQNSNNDGYEFYFPKKYPNSTATATVMRMSRANVVYYFDVSDAKEVKVSTSPDMKKYNTLKFVRRTEKEGYLLQGDLPEPSNESSSNVTASFKGGSRSVKRNVLRNHFMRLVNKHNDIELAAHEFIASLKIPAAKMTQFYSGNYIHSAFNVMFACENGECECEGVEKCSDKSIERKHNAILRAYNPRKSVLNKDKIKQAFSVIVSGANKSGSNANKYYVKNMKSLYSQIDAPISQFMADVATNICVTNNNIDGVKYALDIADEITAVDQEIDTNSFYSKSFSGGSKLVEILHHELCKAPFIGNKSREYAPLPISLGAFEDVAQEVPVAPKRVEKEEVEKEVIEENVVEALVEEEDEDEETVDLHSFC